MNFKQFKLVIVPVVVENEPHANEPPIFTSLDIPTPPPTINAPVDDDVEFAVDEVVIDDDTVRVPEIEQLLQFSRSNHLVLM